MNRLTVGVAGHIDHGKTALVRALTGTETDRLKEERERGMSIVLGFAALKVPEGEIDLIDVPGHERFIHTMISGATGVNALLLVVAANESIMPQTREHLALAELLGVKSGVIVITKADLVAEHDRVQIERQVRDGIQDSFLGSAPLCWASVVDGEGIESVKLSLRTLLQNASEPLADRPVYLPIDRVFTRLGHGTVVTGTLHHGTVHVGQRLEILPSQRIVEVRALQIHSEPVDSARAGCRLAVNLRGVKHEDIQRGDALAEHGFLLPTRLLDIHFRVLPDVEAACRGRRTCAYFGTTNVQARIYPMEADRVAPGQTGFVQLRLMEDVYIPVGLRIVLRDVSPAATIGGGRVVDTSPRRHKHIDQNAVANAQIYAFGTAADTVTAKLLDAKESGIETARLASVLALTLKELAAVLTSPDVIVSGEFALHKNAYQAMTLRAEEIVRRHHTVHPLEPGIRMADLRSRLPKQLPQPFFHRILSDTTENGVMTTSRGVVSITGFTPETMMTPVERAITAEIESRFADAGLQPPNISDVVGTDRRRRSLYAFLRRTGRLVETVDRTSNRVICFHADAIASAEQALSGALSGEVGAAVSEINALLHMTRKCSIPLLEHLDSLGLTRRLGNRRVWAGTNGQRVDLAPTLTEASTDGAGWSA